MATYWYLLPEAEQARKAIWEAVSPHTGMKRIDEAFPLDIRKRTLNNTMSIEFKNGSMFHVVGSNNYDSLVGSPPAGIVFSEFSLSDPACWAYLRPILDENGGWALFNFTSRGRNHAWRMLEHARNTESWYAQILPVTDTNVFSKEQVAEGKGELCSLYGEGPGKALWLQEYFCSFDAAVLGAYYSKLMQDAENDRRIGHVPHDPTLSVETWWDIGIGDSTAIWFIQRTGRTIQAINYIERTGLGLPEYIKELNDLGYTYSRHIAPHDFMVREFGSGKSRMETAANLGYNFEIAPKIGVDDGIAAVRAILPRMYFDSKNCERGIDCLRAYSQKYDEKKRMFMNKPNHDWTSHGADAMRYGAVSAEPTTHLTVDSDPFADRGRRSGGWMA